MWAMACLGIENMQTELDDTGVNRIETLRSWTIKNKVE
jgi:hypothetical protein